MCTGVCTLTCVVVYLSMCSTCVCVNNRLCTVNKNQVSQVCAPPLQTPSPAPRPPYWSCLTTLSSVLCVVCLPAGTLWSFKDHLQRTSSPLRGVRWRPTAVTCSSAGSEGGATGGAELVYRVGGGAEVSRRGGSLAQCWSLQAAQ